MEGAGLLDRCIRIESPTRAQDSFGEAIETWGLVESVRAGIRYLRGTEPFQGDQYNARKIMQFTIRYRTGVDESCRIVWEGDTYDINSIAQVGRRQWLNIVAEALVPTV